MKRLLRRWLNCLLAPRADSSSQPEPKIRWRWPEFDVLEDRLAPATITVTTPFDSFNFNDGVVSLREAIAAANAQSAGAYSADINFSTVGANTIVFGGAAASSNIIVNGVGNDDFGPSAFAITSNITIDGAGFAGRGIERSLAGTQLRHFLLANGNGHLQLKNIALRYGSVAGSAVNTDDGGSILVRNGQLSLTNVTFFNNSARHGGAIAQNGGTVNFLGAGNVFDHNSAGGSGGGHDQIGGSSNGFASFTNNIAGDMGGGYHLKGGSGSLSGLSGYTFTGNHAALGGFIAFEDLTFSLGDVNASSNQATHGGAFFFHNSTVTLSNVNLASNQASSDGGAILVDGSNLTVQGSSVLRANKSSGAGGAIAIFGTNPNVTITGTTIGGTVAGDANTAVHGGGISISTGKLSVENNSVVAANSASSFGGGIYVAGGELTVRTGAAIRKNAASAGGGIAVNNASAKLVIDSATLGGTASSDGNTASTGGGLYIASVSTASIHATTIQHNKAGNDGGGIAHAGLGAVTLTSSTLKNNIANNDGGSIGDGGAIAVTGSGPLTTFDVTFGGLAAADANKAVNGGAVAVTGSATVALNRSTLANNTATGSGGGFYASAGASAIVNSTISANNASGAFIAGGTTRFTNSTIAFNQVSGVTRTAGTVGAGNSLFSNNVGNDFTGAVTSLGTNLFGTATGLTGFGASDLVSSFANLQALALNDGAATATHAVDAASDVLNSGTNSIALDISNAPLTTDQRGGSFVRVFGGVVDIGAYELRDTTPPGVTVSAVPAGTLATNTSIFFEFKFNKRVRNFVAADVVISNGNAIPATFNQIDNRTYIMSLTPLINGLVTVTVPANAAQDLTGNPNTVGSGSVTYDTVKAVATIGTKPPGFTNSLTATFSFTGTDPLFNGVNSGVARLEYQLDSSVYATATSPLTLNNIPEGAHTFRVRAIDNAGNVGDPVDYTWVIDITLPTAFITATPPALTRNNVAAFNFMGADPASNGIASGVHHLEIQIDGTGWRSATSPFVPNPALTDGEHKFEVRTVDNAGNISNSVSYTWTIDATGPIVTLTDKPGLFSNVTTPTFAFTANDPIVNGFASGVAHIEYRFDNGNFITATSPVTLPTLAEGSHSFHVRAVDVAGNIGATTTYTWTIDTVKPTVTISAPSPTTTINGPITFVVTYNDLNMGPITLTADNITLNKTGTASATVVVSGSAGVTRTVTLTNTIGNGTLGITVNAGSGADLAGNLALASSASLTFEVTGTRTLAVSQPAAPAYFLPGSSYIDYIDYSTAGTQNSVNAYLLMSLPTLSTFDAANSTNGWTAVSSTQYRFNLGILPPGSSGRVAFAVVFSADTPPGTLGVFTAIMSDELGGGAAVASHTVSAGIFDPFRPRWQRG